MDLQPGLRVIRNHESSLALALGHTIKGTAASASASELDSGLGGEEERVVFGLVIHPAAAEQAHGFVGRRREGEYDSSCVDGVAWEILVHLILSHSFFEPLY